MGPSPDQLLLSFARAHHGLFRTGDALRCGLTRHQLYGRVRRGLVEPIGKGVYRVGGAPGQPRQELLAGAWRARGVASHRSAAELLGISDRAAPRPELTVDRAGAHEHRGLIVHRSGDLDRSLVLEREGIPVTGPARTLVDIGQVVSLQLLEQLVHRAVHAGLVRLSDIADEYRALSRPGRHGAGPIGEVLRALDPAMAAAESVLEVLILRIIREAGLPEPVRQYEVVIEGRRLRLDFAYPDQRVFLEGDGFGAHGTRSAFENDRVRQNLLVVAGWRPLRFTWRQARFAPHTVIATVAAALGLSL
ncbi:MAG: type IV toxin-antitoxin system AbiEi family antitoxin domain-containing protein [Microthrixaceae bacterium]